MKKLVVIRGHCGTGKSTVAKYISKEKSFGFLEYDIFLWTMNSFGKPTKKIYELTLKNFICVIKNYFKEGKSIVIEGPLVSRSKEDPFKLKKIIDLAKKHKYEIFIIQLIGEEKELVYRMKKRKQIVPKWERDQFIKKHKEDIQKNEIIIDTTNMDLRQVIDKVEEIIK